MNNQNREKDTTKDSDLIDISELIDIILNYYKSIILITVGFTFLVSIYSFSQPNIYRSQALVTPVDDQSGSMQSLSNQFGGLAALAGIANNDINNVDTNIAILQSRVLLEGFIKEKNLMRSIFFENWDEKNDQWIDNEIPNIDSAISTLQGAIKVIDKKRMKVISIDWSDPVLATQWCNEIVVYLNNHIRKQKIEEAEKSIFFLEEELKKTSLVNNKSILFSLIEEQTKNITLANVREEYAFKFIDRAYLSTTSKVRPLRTQTIIFGSIVGFIISIISILSFVLVKKLKPRFNQSR